jgi:hypothetical protein
MGTSADLFAERWRSKLELRAVESSVFWHSTDSVKSKAR